VEASKSAILLPGPAQVGKNGDVMYISFPHTYDIIKHEEFSRSVVESMDPVV